VRDCHINFFYSDGDAAISPLFALPLSGAYVKSIFGTSHGSELQARSQTQWRRSRPAIPHRNPLPPEEGRQSARVRGLRSYPNALHIVSIETAVAADQWQTFDLGLSGEHAVERVSVVMRQLVYGECVRKADHQHLEAIYRSAQAGRRQDR
jgi:hypothetical protein